MPTDPGRNDTDPQPRVSTDPGLGVVVRPVLGVERAITEPVPQPSPSPSDVAPSAADADVTPVPPETDGILDGLIAGQNKVHFRTPRPSPESHGEDSAAFH